MLLIIPSFIAFMGILILAIAGFQLYLFYKNKRTILDLKYYDYSDLGSLLENYNQVSQELGTGHYSMMVKVTGEVSLATPLTSPLSNKDCVYYKTKAYHWYEVYEKDGDDDVGTWVEREREICTTIKGDSFSLGDNSGKIEVLIEGADIIVPESMNYRVPSSERKHFDNGTYEPEFTRSKRSYGYKEIEEIIAQNQKVYILGELHDRLGYPVISKPSNSKDNFTISSKNLQAVVNDKKKRNSGTKFSVIVQLVIGIGLVSLSVYFFLFGLELDPMSKNRFIPFVLVISTILGFASNFFFKRWNKKKDLIRYIQFTSTTDLSEAVESCNYATEQLGRGSYNEVVKLYAKVDANDLIKAEHSEISCVYFESSAAHVYDRYINKYREQEVKEIGKSRIPQRLKLNNKQDLLQLDIQDAQTYLRQSFNNFVSCDEIVNFSFGPFIPEQSDRIRTKGYNGKEYMIESDQEILVIGELNNKEDIPSISKPIFDDKPLIVTNHSQSELINIVKGKTPFDLFLGIFLLIVSVGIFYYYFIAELVF